jgi:hypothetical protein
VIGFAVVMADGSTAEGPMRDVSEIDSGSVAPRHEQPCGSAVTLGRCIGQTGASACLQLQLAASVRGWRFMQRALGVRVSSPRWHTSHAVVTRASARRILPITAAAYHIDLSRGRLEFGVLRWEPAWRADLIPGSITWCPHRVSSGVELARVRVLGGRHSLVGALISQVRSHENGTTNPGEEACACGVSSVSPFPCGPFQP